MAAGSRSAASVLRDEATERGYFPMPTVVSGLPTSHRLFRDELFVPFIVVGEVDSAGRGAEPLERDRLRPDGRHLQP